MHKNGRSLVGVIIFSYLFNNVVSSVLLRNVRRFLVPQVFPDSGKGPKTSAVGRPYNFSHGTSLRGPVSTVGSSGG